MKKVTNAPKTPEAAKVAPSDPVPAPVVAAETAPAPAKAPAAGDPAACKFTALLDGFMSSIADVVTQRTKAGTMPPSVVAGSYRLRFNGTQLISVTHV